MTLAIDRVDGWCVFGRERRDSEVSGVAPAAMLQREE
jgi:hypothetical protein